MNVLNRIYTQTLTGDDGKFSWTKIAAVYSAVIAFHTYIDIWWLGRAYEAALLQFALELILAGFLGYAGKRSFQFIGEGVGKISKKTSEESLKAISASTKTTTTNKKQTAPTNKKETSSVVMPRVSNNGNFNISEFESHDGSKMPSNVKRNILMLIENLEVIREACGNRPMTITSGYRSKAHNTAIKGAKNSQHVKGNAADFKVKGMSPKAVYAVIEQLMDDGKIEQGGIGLYIRRNGGWCHYDRRGAKATWNG